MRTARVAFGGAIHQAVITENEIRLQDGRVVKEQEVVWLPPVEPRTVFALSYSTEMLSSIFVYSYFICAFATVMNIFAQKQASARTASVIYSLEIVFSTIFSATLPPILVDRITLTPSLVNRLFHHLFRYPSTDSGRSYYTNALFGNWLRSGSARGVPV